MQAVSGLRRERRSRAPHARRNPSRRNPRGRSLPKVEVRRKVEILRKVEIPGQKGGGEGRRRVEASGIKKAATSPAGRGGQISSHAGADHLGAGRRAWPQTRRIRSPDAVDRARAVADGTRHLLGDVERALLLQVLENSSADAAHARPPRDPGPGRERRRHRHRRWLGLRVQDGEPQPPELYRAVSGRHHRRWRHPAGRLHHGRAADRLPQRAVVRRARASQDPAPGVRRGRRHRRLRQQLRRADGRRPAALPHPLRRQHPRQRHGGRASPKRTRFSTRRRPASACRSSISARRPGATAFTAPPWHRRSSTRIPRTSARPCRSATRSPKSCCSKPASKSWPRAA